MQMSNSTPYSFSRFQCCIGMQPMKFYHLIKFYSLSFLFLIIIPLLLLFQFLLCIRHLAKTGHKSLEAFCLIATKPLSMFWQWWKETLNLQLENSYMSNLFYEIEYNEHTCNYHCCPLCKNVTLENAYMLIRLMGIKPLSCKYIL